MRKTSSKPEARIRPQRNTFKLADPLLLYDATRQATELLAAPLSAEDCALRLQFSGLRLASDA